MSRRNDLLTIVQRAAPKQTQTLALATVTTLSPFYVTFDEDAGVETTMTFPIVGTYTPVLGDRVLMAKVNGSWVVMNAINGGSAPVSWTALTLTGTWTNLGGSYATLRYGKVAGIVYVQGVVQKTNPTASDTIVTAGGATGLPAGFRPASSLLFPATYSNGFATRINITNTGGINITSGTAPAAGTWNLGVAMSYPAEV